MDREVFAARLARSAESARTFAQSFITEVLPETLTFRLLLNQSYDGQPPLSGEARFPQDSGRRRALALRQCDLLKVVDELWRDGRVPEWVNLAVVDETGTSTVIEVVCCGRFTDDESLLYHRGEGSPPFHALGPRMPPGDDESRFSIHHRAEGADRADLERLIAHSDQIQFFTLHTDEFDQDRLSALPSLANATLFEHQFSSLGANALSAFGRFESLRTLRLALAEHAGFTVGRQGNLRTLTDLHLAGLPPRAWGLADLAVVAPAVTQLDLTASGTLWLDDAFSPRIRRLHLAGKDISGTPSLPARLAHLEISLQDGTDQQVEDLTDGVQEIRSISLRGTPVGDRVALALAQRPELQYLSLVDTAVTTDLISHLNTTRPELTLFPRIRKHSALDLRPAAQGRPEQKDR